MNYNFKKYIIIAITVFIIMFFFRLIYGFVYPHGVGEGHSTSIINQEQFYDSVILRKNIASKKIVYQSDSGKKLSFDQKYEKIAHIETRSSAIEEDEKKTRDLVKKTDSVIQFENTSGLKSNQDRIVRLIIGVPPEKFDLMVSELKNIGKTVSINIDKKDKTNEYKDLQAKKTSLLKIRDSLLQLKNKGGRIDEYINLENRILEIEDAVQKLGISLGEFDSENEFCTVNITIQETSPVERISILHRIRVALEWSIKYYLALSFAFLLATIGLMIGFTLIEKGQRTLMKLKNDVNR